MKRLIMMVPLLLAVMASAPALADDVAAERSRLADQRIQYEQDRRAREEQERLEQAQIQAQSEGALQSAETAEEVGSPAEQLGEETSEPLAREAEDARNSRPVDRIEMSRALEQLRELGALRDAGYVTEEEFDNLKKKILDGAL